MLTASIPYASFFSLSYEQARSRFLEASEAANLRTTAYLHPLKGRYGEELAMDVVWQGAEKAKRILIVSSACHGVEGYCGSGVQVYALQNLEWRQRVAQAASAKGIAVLYIHALNPFGFSHIRRVTHENVDLNRNFQDFSSPLPSNEPYAKIHDLLLPEVWPPNSDNQRRFDEYIATHGLSAFQAAATGGQYQYPDGIFFGGQGPTWSNLTLRQVLKQFVGSAEHLAWIDIHTGLGPNGVGERIYAGWNDPAAIDRARQWWGGGGATPITSIYDGSSSSAPLTGLMWGAVRDECPQAIYTGLAMEYGTEPVTEVLLALRAEQWLNLHPQASPEQANLIKAQFLKAFYTDTDEWKEKILAQAMQSMDQAIDGLTQD